MRYAHRPFCYESNDFGLLCDYLVENMRIPGRRNEMIKCKITVLKRTFNKEFIDEYVEENRKATIGPCEMFYEGQEFVTDVLSGMPQGFCSWAWDDIYKSLIGFFTNGDFGMWYQRKDIIIACCTDGTRPVIFKIEKLVDAT